MYDSMQSIQFTKPLLEKLRVHMQTDNYITTLTDIMLGYLSVH
jgi:hypothetical protein